MASERLAYFNGEWIEDRGLMIPVSDLGFAQGVTITERLRTFAGRVWRQAEHIERLRHSAATIGIHTSIVDEIDGVITEYMSRHESQRAAATLTFGGVEDDWAIVAFATPGTAGEPTRAVHGFPLKFASWAHLYTEGVSVWISDHREVPANSWPPRLKCRSRMHYYLADQQAAKQEPGAQAILLDQEGFIGQGSIANVVIYNADEGIVSPKLSKLLPGVSVAVLRELAEEQGEPFTERDITVEEFLAADEAWFTSTSSCLLPIGRCNGAPIGAGLPGRIYQQMLAAWDRSVGIAIAEQAQRIAEIRG